MAFLDELKLKNSGIRVNAQRDISLRNAISDFRKLFDTYSVKARFISSIESKARKNKLSNEEIVSIAQNIEGINKQLIPLLTRFLKDVNEGNALEAVGVLQVLQTHSSLKRQMSAQEQLNFRNFVAKLKENLESLLGMINSENQLIPRIKSSKFFEAQRVPFVHQLIGEMVLLKLVDADSKRFILEMQAEVNLLKKDEVQKQSQEIRIEEIVVPDSRFNRFYTLLSKFFPPEELEPAEKLGMGLHARFTFNGIFGMTHIIAAEYRGEYIGAVSFDFLAPLGYSTPERKFVKQPPFAIGIVWWMFFVPEAPPKVKSLGFKLLLDKMVEILKKDAGIKGIPLKGLFAEVNDPQKMSSAQISEDVVNPIQRLMLFTKFYGLKSVLKDYIQALAFDSEKYEQDVRRAQASMRKQGKNDAESRQLALEAAIIRQEKDFANYCHLLYTPYDTKWKQKGMTREDLLCVIYGLYAISNVWPRAYISKLPSYKKMYDIISASQQAFGTLGYHKTMDNFLGLKKKVKDLWETANPEIEKTA